MALIDLVAQKVTTGVQLGTRNDYCYLCARELVAKDEREYNKKFNALKGKQEGKPVLKIGRTQGSEMTVCMECIHKIAKQNPIEKK